MICPVCGIELKPVERQGLELDHCPQCQGLWLDQGELTELVRRESLAAIAQGQEALAEARKHQEFDARITELPGQREQPFILQ